MFLLFLLLLRVAADNRATSQMWTPFNQFGLAVFFVVVLKSAQQSIHIHNHLFDVCSAAFFVSHLVDENDLSKKKEEEEKYNFFIQISPEWNKRWFASLNEWIWFRLLLISFWKFQHRFNKTRAFQIYSSTSHRTSTCTKQRKQCLNKHTNTHKHAHSLTHPYRETDTHTHSSIQSTYISASFVLFHTLCCVFSASFCQMVFGCTEMLHCALM